MALKPGLQLTVDSSSAQQVDGFAEGDASGGGNNAAALYGQTVAFIPSAPVHLGGTSSVANTGANRGALLPGGFLYSIDLKKDDHVYLIAPAGQTVTVERFQVGV